MSMLYTSKIKFDNRITKGLERFVRIAHRELSDAGFYSFWFNIKVKNNSICVYMYYDLDPEDSEKILSWHIYLQEKLDECIKGIDLKKYDSVVFIMESDDLWSDKDGKKVKSG